MNQKEVNAKANETIKNLRKRPERIEFLGEQDTTGNTI